MKRPLLRFDRDNIFKRNQPRISRRVPRQLLGNLPVLIPKVLFEITLVPENADAGDGTSEVCRAFNRVAGEDP